MSDFERFTTKMIDFRQQFLREQWQRFPVAPPSLISVGDNLSVPSDRGPRSEDLSAGARCSWWGGRLFDLRRQEGKWSLTLSSVLGAKTWRFDELLLLRAWKNASGEPDVATFSPDQILRCGDQVALAVGPAGEGQRAMLLLLAPCQGEPLRFGASLIVMDRWQKFLDFMDRHFVNGGFRRVSTPTLVSCPGMEVHLEPFKTEFIYGHEREVLFLPTSPELHLKKLLSANWPRIFEVRSVFRNGEVTPHHQPEFTMVEWYRLYGAERDLISDLIELLNQMKALNWIEGDLPAPQVVTVAQLFRQHFDFEMSPHVNIDQLRVLARKQSLTFDDQESFDEIFHRLWLEKIEPWLLLEKAPTLVRLWPAPLAALARLDSMGWAERVELYWRGLELANGFSELNDPLEQRRRFQADQLARQRAGRMAVPIDEEFMRALNSGQPPAAGMALGLDRLFMAAQNVTDIRQLRLFARAIGQSIGQSEGAP